MRAYYYNKYGKAGKVDILGTLPKPEADKLAPGELLVEVHASSLNPIDYKTRNGDMKALFRRPFPHIHGYDFAGKVIAKGSETDEFNTDDMIFGLVRGSSTGGCAEFLVVRADVCALVPTNTSPAEAACVSLVGATSIVAFRRGGLKEHDEENANKRVLILGGAGGVGTAAIQLAKGLYGCGYVATTASPGTKTELCEKLGADFVVNYREDPKFSILKDQQPFDFIFDTVGSVKTAIPYIKEHGVLVSVVSPSVEGLRPYLNASKEDMAFGAHTLFFTTVGKALMNRALGASGIRSKLKKKDAEFDFIGVSGKAEYMMLLKEQLENGNLQPIIDKTYSLDQVKEAMQYLESGRAAGKVVVQIQVE